MTLLDEKIRLREHLARLVKLIKDTDRCDLCIGPDSFCHLHERRALALVRAAERLLKDTESN